MAMAYYGPNAEIMGSVNLKIWHHQNVIDDIEAFAINVGLLAGVDFISFIINGFIIWKFCNVNPMKMLHKIQKRYWFVMMTLEAYTLGTVSYSDILESSTFRAFYVCYSCIKQHFNFEKLDLFSNHPTMVHWHF